MENHPQTRKHHNFHRLLVIWQTKQGINAVIKRDGWKSIQQHNISADSALENSHTMKFLFQFPCCSCFCYIKRKKSKTTEAAAKHVWSQSGANSVEIYMYTCAKVCLDIWMEWHIVQCTLFHRVKWQVVFYMNKLKYVRWLASLVFFCSFWLMDSNFLHLLFNRDKTSLCKKPAMQKLWFAKFITT
jgi:hypothetical protein